MDTSTATTISGTADLFRLGELEAAIMDDLWAHGESTVDDIRIRLREVTGTDRAYNTVMSVAQRLHRKGYLDRRRIGRAHAYWPTRDRYGTAVNAARQDLNGMIGRYGAVIMRTVVGDCDLLRGAR